MNDVIHFIINLNLYGKLLIVSNFVLFVFAGHFVRYLYRSKKIDAAVRFRINLLRSLSLLMLFAYLYTHRYEADFSGHAVKILGSAAIIYVTFLLIQLLDYFTIRYYGKRREIDNKTHYIVTYQSRLMSLLGAGLLAIIALLAMIQLLGYDSALQAGGVIGFFGVLLALTNNVWAPDMFGGLIILHSDMLEENNVILIKGGENIYARVYKIKVFHTVLLNIVDNHRIMIRNSRLRDFTVHNLSKFASARGLRESLSFKIGYDVKSEAVQALFAEAFERIIMDKIEIEANQKMTLVLQETGDHAIEWRMFYYTKKVAELPEIKQQITFIINELSIQHDISLSTPLTYQVS